MNQIEEAKHFFRILEMRSPKSRIETAVRVICIQEILEDLRKNKIEIEC